jgi:hypothetical protein
MNVKAGANLADIVKALNTLGANPQDLTAILQAMKSAGACAPSWKSSDCSAAAPSHGRSVKCPRTQRVVAAPCAGESAGGRGVVPVREVLAALLSRTSRPGPCHSGVSHERA